MKTLHHTLQKISDLTATIESNYPDLYVALEKHPPVLADIEQPCDLKGFAPYLESLQTLLEEQVKQHENRKTDRLKNLASEVNYNEEKFQTMVLSGKECQQAHLLAVSKGQGLKTQVNQEDVLLIMLEGYCNFTLGDTEQQLKPGEVIRIPAQRPYSLQAITYFKLIMLK